MTRQHRLAPALALAAILATVTACQSQESSDPEAAAARPAFTPIPASTGTGPCTADYGPDNTGLSISGGTITGTVSIGCFPQPGDPHIEVVLVRKDTSTGQTVTPHSSAYTSTQNTMTATAPCSPGVWTLAASITAIVNNAPTDASTYGQDIQVTAADCGS